MAEDAQMGIGVLIQQAQAVVVVQMQKELDIAGLDVEVMRSDSERV